MNHYSAEALILDVFNLHDQDRIVTFLTGDWGKKRGVAQGARRKYSRYAGQLQPLAKVAVSWFEKEERELVRVQGVDVLRTAHPLQQDLEGILLGSYLADHVVEFAQEGEASHHLYRLLDSTLEALLQGTDRDLAARYFEAWVLRLAGVFPAPRQCPLCGEAFSAAGAILPAHEEALLCRNCASPDPGGMAVDGQVLGFLDRISRENLKSMARAPVEPRVLRHIETLSGQVRRRFLQHELRSYEVMKRTLLAVQ